MPKEHNDYRPIALTSVIMITLEKKCVQRLNRALLKHQDPFQIAYKQGRGTEDAVVTLVHLVSKHLDTPKTYVRGLFLDFFSSVQYNSARHTAGKNDSAADPPQSHTLVLLLSHK